MMHVLVLYDISNDRIRSKIATTCEDYGLDRIQYSAFYGQLKRTYQEELMLRIADLLQDENGKIQLIPISAADWDKQIQLNKHEW